MPLWSTVYRYDVGLFLLSLLNLSKGPDSTCLGCHYAVLNEQGDGLSVWRSRYLSVWIAFISKFCTLGIEATPCVPVMPCVPRHQQLPGQHKRRLQVSSWLLRDVSLFPRVAGEHSVLHTPLPSSKHYSGRMVVCGATFLDYRHSVGEKYTKGRQTPNSASWQQRGVQQHTITSSSVESGCQVY